MPASFRVAYRLCLIVMWMGILIIPLLIAGKMRQRNLHENLLMLFFRGTLCVMGISVRRKGDDPAERPTLFISNHASYIDVFVMGALLPLRYTPKKDAESWPLISTLINLTNPLYIDRANRTAIRQQQQDLQQALADGDNILLFPEGTTSDGNEVLPFKSALFSVAETTPGGHPVTVQPFTIAYTGLNGEPLQEHERLLFAWYGDTALIPHLLKMLTIRRSCISVMFHPATSIAAFRTRKALCEHCESVVRGGFEELIADASVPMAEPA